MHATAIHGEPERNRLDRSARCAEKRRRRARSRQLRGLIRPVPAARAAKDAGWGEKCLSGASVQAIFTSEATPLGECRLLLGWASKPNLEDSVSIGIKGAATCAALCTMAGPALATFCPATQHDVTTTINGIVPPGEVAPLVDVTTMIDTVMPDGNRLVVMKGTRRAGTRVGIHVHKFGGHTCVMSGAITDFVEGMNPGRFPKDKCYYMPAETPMTAANLGTEDAVLIDTFILPPGEDMITIIETCPTQ